MLPLKRHKNFKNQVEKLFAKEILELSEDIGDLYDDLIKDNIDEFYPVFEDNQLVIKIRPVVDSDKYLYFYNIEGFSLNDFTKAVLIVDQIFRNNGFMYAINENGDVVLSRMDFDGNSPYFHIKKNGDVVINKNFEEFSYILFLLGIVLESYYDYEETEG